ERRRLLGGRDRGRVVQVDAVVAARAEARPFLVGALVGLVDAEGGGGHVNISGKGVNTNISNLPFGSRRPVTRSMRASISISGSEIGVAAAAGGAIGAGARVRVAIASCCWCIFAGQSRIRNLGIF